MLTHAGLPLWHPRPRDDRASTDVQANGQCFLVRRDVARARSAASRGVADSICEDVTLARAVAARGHPVGFYETGRSGRGRDVRAAGATPGENWPRSLPLRDRFSGAAGAAGSGRGHCSSRRCRSGWRPARAARCGRRHPATAASTPRCWSCAWACWPGRRGLPAAGRGPTGSRRCRPAGRASRSGRCAPRRRHVWRGADRHRWRIA